MLIQLTQFWLDTHHSDVVLNLTAPCQCSSACHSAQQRRVSGVGYCGSTLPAGCADCAASSLGQQISVHLPCHRVLLSAASAYFSALLSPTWAGSSISSDARIVPIVLSDSNDIPAMIALLKCIYCGEINLLPGDISQIMSLQQGNPTAIGATITTAAESCNIIHCSNTAALTYLSHQLEQQALCWQELSVRVIRLADQFSVPGAIKVAAAKLSCLFSYQLSWPAVLAVLWLPGALAQQPCLRDLRQMAMNRVIQDMKHLDQCLASAFGRSILQQLPPDAFATLLGSDQLALTSENSTLAAIDVWLAGPVAESLSSSSSRRLSDFSTTTATSPATDGHTIDMADNHIAAASPPPAAAAAGAMHFDSTDSKLAEVLQLLLRQVRLPLCSGAFLAAAVVQRPWLCVGLRHNDDIMIMKQYYSLDSEGRYNLAMKLLRSNQSCPWSVMLRRGLPTSFSSSTSTIHSNVDAGSSSSSSSYSSNQGVQTPLSQIRALLVNQPGLHTSRSSSQALDGLLRVSSSSSLSDTDSCKAKQQQQQLLGKQLQDVHLLDGMTSRGLVIHKRILGGYHWQMALVAVPVVHINSVCADAAAANGLQKQQMQLCLHVCCTPAWADVLDTNSSSSSAVIDGDTTAAAEPTAGGSIPSLAACDAVQHSAAAAAAAGDLDTGLLHLEAGCVACDALWTIAGAKAAEAVARHAPQMPFKPAANPTAAAAALAAAEATIHEDLSDQTFDAGSDISSSQSSSEDMSLEQIATSSTVLETVIAGSDPEARAATFSKHLNVVVGVQLLACSSKEQLQQLLGDGPGSINSSSHGSPAQTHLACLLEYDTKTDTNIGLIPVNVHAIDTGKNLLQTCYNNDKVPSVMTGVYNRGTQQQQQQQQMLEGWQPELWSMLAPSGVLQWHVGIRMVSD